MCFVFLFILLCLVIVISLSMYFVNVLVCFLLLVVVLFFVIVCEHVFDCCAFVLDKFPVIVLDVVLDVSLILFSWLSLS